jgi:hypothetical protein
VVLIHVDDESGMLYILELSIVFMTARCNNWNKVKTKFTNCTKMYEAILNLVASKSIQCISLTAILHSKNSLKKPSRQCT